MQYADEDFRQMFKNNLAGFAAAKAAHLAQDIRKLNVLDELEFNLQAKILLNTYTRYQAAEYNTFVHRARVAKQFAQFQREKHLYPNVEWLRTRSADPREKHLAYVGRVWALDDQFLVNNHPGCVWQCKCSWTNTRKETTDNTQVANVPAASGLEGNPYFTRKIVAQSHPYYTGIPKHIANNASLLLPDETAFINFKTEKGNEYAVHYNAIEEQELQTNEPIAQILADNGFAGIRLLPRIHARQQVLRTKLFGKAYSENYKTSNPDAIWQGTAIEFKASLLQNIVSNVNKAAKQANVIVIKCTDSQNTHEVLRKGMKAFHENKQVKQLILISAKNEILTINR